MLEWALRYAQLGWRVFPVIPPNEDGSCPCRKPVCPSPGKHPGVKAWQNVATTDEAKIREWWASNPRYNIGLAMGIESGVLVLDADGAHGIEAAREKGLPITPSATTGREGGGTHYYFKCPVDMDARNFAGRIPGLDARANGGYVVAPPSRHASGVNYQWVDDPWDVEPAFVPDWLAEELGRAPAETVDGSQWIQGSRNEKMFSMGRSMRRTGLSELKVLEHLRAANIEYCKPPLDNDEIEQIAANVCREEYSRGPELMIGIEDVDLGQVETTGSHLRKNARSEMGTAECFVELFTGKLLWVPEWKQWFKWNGVYWAEDLSRAHYRAMMQTVRARAIGSGMLPSKEERQMLQTWALSMETNARIEGTLKVASTLPAMIAKAEDFDQDPMLVGMPNGTWDLRIGVLRDPDPADRITRVTAVGHDPDATCPLWEQTVADVFLGDEQKIGYFQRLAGYCITGLTREQMMSICHGHGRNGKSTLLATLRDVLGDYGGAGRWETFDADERSRVGDDLAALRGKRYVMVVENEQGGKLAESRVKSVTGGEPVTVRHLYGRDFEMRPEFKILLAVNHKPFIRGSDEGIWRRIHMLSFDAEFEGEGRDVDRQDRLREEMPGILGWILKGAAEYLAEGLKPPLSVVTATKEYRRESDIVGLWLEDNTKKSTNGKLVAQSELYGSYREWSQENGLKPMSSNALSRILTERGYERKRNSKGLAAYMGLEVLDRASFTLFDAG